MSDRTTGASDAQIEAAFRRVGELAIANAIQTAIHDSSTEWIPVTRALAEKWELI